MLFQVLKKNAVQQNRPKTSKETHKNFRQGGLASPYRKFFLERSWGIRLPQIAAGKDSGLANIAAKAQNGSAPGMSKVLAGLKAAGGYNKM
jgi:hypothetical protein